MKVYKKMIITAGVILLTSGLGLADIQAQSGPGPDSQNEQPWLQNQKGPQSSASSHKGPQSSSASSHKGPQPPAGSSHIGPQSGAQWEHHEETWRNHAKEWGDHDREWEQH